MEYLFIIFEEVQVKSKASTRAKQPIKPELIPGWDASSLQGYPDTAWGELSATSSKTLQRLQNRAARIVLRRDSSKDTFNALGWAELETKRKRHK